MVGFITFLHVLVCVLIVVTILLQSGKGGGLAESFSSAESLLGPQTNMVMVKVTTVLGILFLTTCLTLAVLSSKKARSLMTKLPEKQHKTVVNVDQLFNQTPSQTIVINAAGPDAETMNAMEQ